MASGDYLFTLWPHNALETTTVPAGKGTLDDGSTVVGQLPTLLYQGATADQHADWIEVMPDAYDGGGLDFTYHYAMDGTVGTAVEMEIRADMLDASDAIGSHNLGAQTAVSIADTPNGTANTMDISPSGSLSHANAGSPAAGKIIRCRASRDYDHAANADELQLICIVATET